MIGNLFQDSIMYFWQSSPINVRPEEKIIDAIEAYYMGLPPTIWTSFLHLTLLMFVTSIAGNLINKMDGKSHLKVLFLKSYLSQDLFPMNPLDEIYKITYGAHERDLIPIAERLHVEFCTAVLVNLFFYKYEILKWNLPNGHKTTSLTVSMLKGFFIEMMGTFLNFFFKHYIRKSEQFKRNYIYETLVEILTRLPALHSTGGFYHPSAALSRNLSSSITPLELPVVYMLGPLLGVLGHDYLTNSPLPPRFVKEMALEDKCISTRDKNFVKKLISDD